MQMRPRGNECRSSLRCAQGAVDRVHRQLLQEAPYVAGFTAWEWFWLAARVEHATPPTTSIPDSCFTARVYVARTRVCVADPSGERSIVASRYLSPRGGVQQHRASRSGVIHSNGSLSLYRNYQRTVLEPGVPHSIS
jgi:hypothetical protein